MTPQFRSALTMAAAGMFSFVAGVSITGNHRTTGLAAAATGALLLAVAFPRLWSALPGLPTGRIHPPITNSGPGSGQQPGPVVALFDPDPAPAPAVPPPGVDPHTGEIIPDPVAALAGEIAALGAIVSEQSELWAQAFATVRAEVAALASPAQAPQGPKP